MLRGGSEKNAQLAHNARTTLTPQPRMPHTEHFFFVAATHPPIRKIKVFFTCGKINE